MRQNMPPLRCWLLFSAIEPPLIILRVIFFRFDAAIMLLMLMMTASACCARCRHYAVAADACRLRLLRHVCHAPRAKHTQHHACHDAMFDAATVDAAAMPRYVCLPIRFLRSRRYAPP